MSRVISILLSVAQDFIMRLGLECHYQRCTSSLALHHPLIANKVEYSIEQLPPIFDESKISENTESIRTSLRALLMIASYKRKYNFHTINSLEHAEIEPGMIAHIPESLTSIDNEASHRSRMYVRGMINNSGGTLHDDMIINKGWKSRRQLRALKGVRTIVDSNDRYSKFSVDMNSEKTPKTLPFIDVAKQSLITQTYSSGKRSDSKTIKKVPVKSSKISQWSKYDENESPPKKNRHIQEFLERIMQKDKEARELSQSVIAKQNKDGDKFSRAQTLEPESARRSTQKQEVRFNFTSVRQPEIIKNNHRVNGHISIDINEQKEYKELRKSSLIDAKPKCPNSPNVYHHKSHHKKFKVVSNKDRDFVQTGKSVQEGGTVSTQDY